MRFGEVQDRSRPTALRARHHTEWKGAEHARDVLMLSSPATVLTSACPRGNRVFQMQPVPILAN